MKIVLNLMMSFLLFMVSAENNPSIKLDQLLPASFDDWKATGEDKIYTPYNIYDLIDGGAELYLSYGFKLLLVRRYQKENYPNIEVNLFEMSSSENAFGIFQNDVEDEEVGIGQGSEYAAGWLRFWKRNFFVYIFTEQETQSLKQAILDLGHLIAEKIPSPGNKPDLLQYLPKSGMIDKSLRFFHNYQNLNYHYYLSNQNILNLSEQTNAVLAHYNQGESTAYILLIQYPNREQANLSFKNFLKIYLNNENLIQTENGKWSGSKLKDQIIIIVLDASNSIFTDNLFNDILKNIKEKEKENEN